MTTPTPRRNETGRAAAVALATAKSVGCIHIVLTRAVDGQKMAGRLKILVTIRAILGDASPGMKETVLQSLLTTRSPARFLGALGVTLRHAAAGRWLPLQCVLYADPVEIERACAQIGPQTSSVYLDGVRCYPLLETLRKRRPDLRIVVDFDDLMSRRMDLLLKGDQLPSAGYLSTSLPAVLDRVLKNPTLSRLLLRYERATLAAVERRVKTLASAVVLLSSADAQDLAEAAGPEGIEVIAPAVQSQRPARPMIPSPIRFVFIGTDKLRQNQLTIDRLVALWVEHNLQTPLVIFGEQDRGIPLPSTVTAPGYVSTIDEVYDGRSVLLTPSYIGGGIKTKVLEAFAYGAPVIGNSTTFEAMALGDYPFVIDDDAELVAILRNPEAYRARLDQAAADGAAYIASHHHPDLFADRWRGVMAHG